MRKSAVLILLVALLTAALGVTATAGHVQNSVSEITLPISGVDVNSYAGVSWFDYTSTGNIVAYSGKDLIEVTAAGSPVRTLFEGSSAWTYGSFVKVDRANDLIYFGESSNGAIQVMNTDGTGLRTLLTLANNYDMVIDSTGRLLASAADANWENTNLFAIDAETGASTLFGTVAGQSGPLALASDGTLYYGTADAWAPSGTQSILSWNSTLISQAISGGTALSAANANAVISGINGSSGMTFDSAGNLYYAKSSKIWKVSGGTQTQVASAPNRWLTTLHYNPLTGYLDVNVGGAYDGEGVAYGVIASVNPVPEPSALAGIASFAAMAFAVRRRRTV